MSLLLFISVCFEPIHRGLVIGCRVQGEQGSFEQWRALCDGLSVSDSCWLMSLISLQILHCASQYDRRVHQATLTYPYKILLLVKTSPDMECRLRQQIASEILTSREDDLHHVARKIRRLYGPDLVMASRAGILGYRLACALWEIRKIWKTDVREMERVNKQLSLVSDRCPHASVELVSARTMIKHYLGAAVGGKDLTEAQRKKWSTFKPVATDLLNRCMGSWDDKSEVLSNPHRWETPAPVQALSAAEPLARSQRNFQTVSWIYFGPCDSFPTDCLLFTRC